MKKENIVYVPACDDLGMFPLSAYENLFKLGELLEFLSDYKNKYNNILNNKDLDMWQIEKELDSLQFEKELIGYELEFLEEYFNTSYNDVKHNCSTDIQIVIRTSKPNIDLDDFLY